MISRRNFLKNTGMATAISIAGSETAFSNSFANTNAADEVIGHGEFKYKVDKAWAKISVNSNPLFNCHEMVQDSKGRLIMLGDHTQNNILIFDKSGKLLDSWGTAWPGGHGLSISKEGGEDFLMIVDCGWYQNKTGAWNAQAGQVIKTDLSGRIIFSIGHPKTIGIYKDDEKFMPTETAIGPNGDIYVADGYGSDYIIQYNSKGQYIRHFGGRKNTNPDWNLRCAHGVAIDYRNKNNPTLICTSREENCFKIFTMDGKFLRRIDMPGMHVCRPVLDGENLYAGVCWSNDEAGKMIGGNSGFITILDASNKVISNPGGNAPVYKNNALQATMQAPGQMFQHCHDVCIDEDKNIYVCQWNANNTAPVKLTRI